VEHNINYIDNTTLKQINNKRQASRGLLDLLTNHA